jgi:hypothetical protein
VRAERAERSFVCSLLVPQRGEESLSQSRVSSAHRSDGGDDRAVLDGLERDDVPSDSERRDTSITLGGR